MSLAFVLHRLSYDYEGRISGITYPKGGTNSFSYNGLDARTSMTDSAGSKTFKRNGIGVTSSVLSDGLANFTPGLSERRGGASTFMHSGLKNANAQTSSSQTISATNQYDAFGNLCSSTGTWKGPFGYGGGFGYQSDADSGLKLLGHRYYDSSSGRFLSRDPVRSGRNWYGYCRNCPVQLSDRSGLEDDWIDGAASLFGGWGDGLLSTAPFTLLTGKPITKVIREMLGCDDRAYSNPTLNKVGSWISVAHTALLLPQVGGARGGATQGSLRKLLAAIGKGAYEKPDIYHKIPVQIVSEVVRLGKVRSPAPNYYLYELEGFLNGSPGIYQVGVSYRNGIRQIVHVFFEPR